MTATVAPSYRPDKAINIHKAGFLSYIDALAKSVGKEKLSSMQDVLDALISRLEFFHAHGCRPATTAWTTSPSLPTP